MQLIIRSILLHCLMIKKIIHKLSHQHLYTKFWIVEVSQLNGAAIPVQTIRDYPVPILISKFLDAYNL